MIGIASTSESLRSFSGRAGRDVPGARRALLARPRPGRPALLAAIALACLAGAAFATADGPDFYRVHGVAPDDVLNIRAEPSAKARQRGAIPPDGTCVRNLGCQGGLSFHEFSTLSPAQQKQRLRENPRWCRVEYRGVEGWVAGRYLAEDGPCPR